MFYVDRYFTLTFDGREPVSKRRFQLVALTGLYMAIKIRGESRADCVSPDAADYSAAPPWNRLRLTVGVCASISRNVFGAGDIEECEREILGRLGWRVNPVVPSGTVVDLLLTWLHPVLSSRCGESDPAVESVSAHVYDCAKYLAELSVSVPALCLIHRPSVVAYASIMCSLETLEPTRIITERQRSRYEEAVSRATSRYFLERRDDVESARGILRVICPNLSALIPAPVAIARSGSVAASLPQSPTTSAFFV